MECPATDVVRQRISCLFDLAVPPCMRQLVWGQNDGCRIHLACLGEVILIGSSAQCHPTVCDMMTHDGLLVI